MLTRSQCEQFLAGGGFKAAPGQGFHDGMAAMQSTLSELLKKISWADLFTKSIKLFAIWSTPDWSAAAIMVKVQATYELFSVTPPAPNGPVST